MNATLEAIPTLRIISAATAAREGYKAITTEICPRREAAIFESVQQGLKKTDSVWIEAGRAGFWAGRRVAELLEIEAMLSDDDRRDADPILDNLPSRRSQVDADQRRERETEN